MTTRLLLTSMFSASLASAGADGPPVVRFSLSSDSVTLGEPVTLTMQCRNDGDRPATVDLGWDHRDNLGIQATFPDGHQEEVRSDDVRRNRPDRLLTIGFVHLAPHSSESRTLLLNDLVDLHRTGHYTFQFRLADPNPSNPLGQADIAGVENGVVHLFVDIRNEKVLKERCRELIAKANSGRVEDENNAMIALGYMKDPVAVPYLIAWVESRTTDRTVGNIAFQSLGMIGGEEAARYLLTVVNVPRPEGILNHSVLDAGNALMELKPTITDAKLSGEVEHAIDSINAEWLRNHAWTRQ